MASAFTLTDLSLHYSEKHLLEHVTLTVSEGDKIGIVGRNGAGKSTLLRLLAGTEEPDRGEVSRKRGLTVAYLPQTPDLNPEATITQAALDYLPAATPQEREAAAYEAQTILSRLGFTDFQQKVSTLSGGQKMRVALAGVLCRPTEALLLDEPTNHIDLDTAAWLEEQLIRYRGTLLCVTHDRYLLQRVFSRIFHVGNGGVQTYQTDYAGYLEERAQREEMAAATLRKQRSLYRTELSWIQRGARARSTKAKGRIDRFETLQENVREAPPEAKLEIKSVASRLGKKILSCEHLGCELGGRTLIRDFSYTLLRDDRVGIVGDNGAGKTTLLRLLSGDLPPTRGSVELGETVRLGVFAQHCPPMDPDARIIDAIRDVAVKVYTPDGEMSASQMAETFLFPSGMQYQKVSSLSGGEHRRLYLLRVLMAAPNVLLLDEPTNDLDLETLNVLEDYLDGFQGAVVAVSHDRYFLDRVTRKLFALANGELTPYNGGCEDYLADKAARETAPSPEKKQAPQPPRERPASKRFTFKEQRDFDTIEGTIASLEAELDRLGKELEANSANYARVTELMAKQEETQAALDAAMERWMYLQERYEEITAAQEQSKR